MLSKMNAELKKQFAAVLRWVPCFLFSLFELFRLWKSSFFCLSAGCNARIRPSEIRTGR